MTVITVFGLVVAFLTLWFVQYGPHGVRRPLWPAFSSTLASVVFLSAGAFGYNLSTPERFVEGTAWRDGVIWWQVWIGVALLVFAGAMWRHGLRAIRSGSISLNDRA